MSNSTPLPSNLLIPSALQTIDPGLAASYTTAGGGPPVVGDVFYAEVESAGQHVELDSPFRHRVVASARGIQAEVMSASSWTRRRVSTEGERPVARNSQARSVEIPQLVTTAPSGVRVSAWRSASSASSWRAQATGSWSLSIRPAGISTTRRSTDWRYWPSSGHQRQRNHSARSDVTEVS